MLLIFQGIFVHTCWAYTGEPPKSFFCLHTGIYWDTAESLLKGKAQWNRKRSIYSYHFLTDTQHPENRCFLSVPDTAGTDLFGFSLLPLHWDNSCWHRFRNVFLSRAFCARNLWSRHIDWEQVGVEHLVLVNWESGVLLGTAYLFMFARQCILLYVHNLVCGVGCAMLCSICEMLSWRQRRCQFVYLIYAYCKTVFL
jgi:hypothetical protein